MSYHEVNIQSDHYSIFIMQAKVNVCWMWVGYASQVQICADIVGNLHSN